ncbi:MAG: serine hydrolase [Ichthyobacteriaceae bacterium]|nr:serine hydrolase [Ichthyobacteriaceae bacterium]
MKKITKLLKWPLLFIVIVIGGLYITGNGFLVKAISLTYGRGNTTASIDDYTVFPNRLVLSGDAQPWDIADENDFLKMTPRIIKEHENMESIAFLVIQHDKIILEKYWDGYNKNSLSNSFSMAKSIVTMLMQKAIEDGYIESLNQKVGDFIPHFKEGKNNDLTVGDLSRMSAGLDWNEAYSSPFSVTTESYFTNDLSEFVNEIDVKNECGKEYKYQSGATQILAQVITIATKTNLSNYASNKFWKPMGAVHDAYWMLDKQNGMEKAFCCFNSNARDFARFGKLWLNKGKWNGKQLISEDFVNLSINPVYKDTPYYGYSWWLEKSYFKTPVHFMRGILGQYVVVVPEHDLIIVRLGHKRGEKIQQFPSDFYVYVEEVLKMIKN